MQLHLQKFSVFGFRDFLITVQNLLARMPTCKNIGLLSVVYSRLLKRDCYFSRSQQFYSLKEQAWCLL